MRKVWAFLLLLCAAYWASLAVGWVEPTPFSATMAFSLVGLGMFVDAITEFAKA